MFLLYFFFKSLNRIEVLNKLAPTLPYMIQFPAEPTPLNLQCLPHITHLRLLFCSVLDLPLFFACGFQRNDFLATLLASAAFCPQMTNVAHVELWSSNGPQIDNRSSNGPQIDNRSSNGPWVSNRT